MMLEAFSNTFCWQTHRHDSIASPLLRTHTWAIILVLCTVY